MRGAFKPLTFNRVSDANPPGMNKYIGRVSHPTPYELLPGLFAHTAFAQDMMWDLYSTLSAAAPASTATEEGVGWPGVPEGWSRLLNIMGVPHNPEGVPPYDAAKYVAYLKATKPEAAHIQTRLSPASRERMKLLYTLLIDGSARRSVRIKNEVSIGVPTFEKSLEAKHAVVSTWISHAREIVDLVRRYDLQELYSRFGFLFAYNVGRRYQPDPVAVDSATGIGTPKDRVVYTFDGEWAVADKTLPDIVEQSRHRAAFFACRSRKINASPLGATFPLRIFARAIQEHVDSVYPFTFYHTGPADVLGKVHAMKYISISDVDNNDVAMPSEGRDIYIDCFRTRYGRDAALFLEASLRAPQLVKNDLHGTSDVRLEGDPYDLRGFNANYVNPSGNPFTSLLTKAIGVFHYYDALVELGRIEEGRDAAVEFLCGRSSYKVLNAGDNVLFATNEKGLAESIRSNVPYCSLSQTATFQGLVAVRDGRGYLRFKPNINSFVVNRFAPGRSIRSEQAGDWALGWAQRKAIYADAPTFRDVDAAVNEVVRHHMGETMDSLAARHAPSGVLSASLSAVDAEFILNPDVIEYKRHVDEISPELVRRFFLSIEPSHYAPVLEGFDNVI